ncbi:MAG: polyprenol monophosphomannose synthase [Bryobacteraceae bacterium]|jgi:dolichol-phosphate mannosyltransferase
MRTIVVVPTFNERDNLVELVATIFVHAEDAHILIVDDNSPDGTGQLADELSQQYPGRLFVLHREKKQGLGPAYVAGFEAVLQQGYEMILQMDGDLSHDPSYLPGLRERCQNCDLVLGSRFVHGVNVVNWDLKRLLLSRLASQYARFLLRIPFSDPTGGFKCWRHTALRSLNLQQVRANGYLFQIEMTYKAFRKGFKIEEFPIIFYERKVGRSKLDWKIILEAILGVVRLRMDF